VLVNLVRDHRDTPADDLTSALIDARDDENRGGDRLTENELVDTLLLLLGAGHETTVNLLDHAITALLSNTEQLASVRAGRHSWAEVTEEALRWQSPIAYLPLRYAVSDISLDGMNGVSDGADDIVIRAGEPILAAYAAAGRDPAVHDNPHLFDLDRPRRDHLAFGYGAHYCLGAPLARLEAEIALPRLFDRFPDTTLAVAPDELRLVASFIANGHSSLPTYLVTPT
jgi:cytochrome P450